MENVDLLDPKDPLETVESLVNREDQVCIKVILIKNVAIMNHYRISNLEWFLNLAVSEHRSDVTETC